MHNTRPRPRPALRWRPALGAALAALVSLQVFGSQAARKTAKPQASVVTSSQRRLARLQFKRTMEFLLANGDKAKARQGFLRAIILDPEFSAPYFDLGVLAEASGKWAEASRWFHGFLRVDPKSKYAPRVRAELAHIRVIERERATPGGRRRNKYDDDIARARVYLNAGMLKPAIANAGVAAKADPERWEAYGIAASALSQAGQSEEAEKFLSMAIARAPESKKAALEKALAALKEGKASKAGKTRSHTGSIQAKRGHHP